MRNVKFFVAAAVTLILSGCIGIVDWDDRAKYGGQSRTDAELAYDSSVRVARLLESCGTTACLAAKAKIEDIGARLVAHVNAPTIGSNIGSWYGAQTKLLDEYSDTKREAYLVLVDSGWVAPAGTDGTGSWDQTWWDFSSP